MEFFVVWKRLVKHKIGVEGLGGITVAIQGLGHVGYDLARRLHNEGAHLIVADINKYLTRKAKEEFNATIVSIDQIHAQEADIFSPCALGGSIIQIHCLIFKLI